MRAESVVPLIFLFIASLILNFPHLYSHVGDLNYDFFLHYNWSKEFASNLFNGDLYPRWIFHGRYGLGEPVFITYSPLHYYLVSLFKTLGLSTWVSMQWVEVFANFGFAWFVFLASRKYVNLNFSLIIALAALLNPFLVMLHYKFQGFAWAGTAYFSHGVLFWALTRSNFEEKSYFNFWAAIAIALAVSSHIISALVNLICYSFYCLSVALHSNKKFVFDTLMGWGITVVTGLALSGVYLLPALYYLDSINSGAWVGEYRTQSFAWPVFTLLGGEAQWISMQWPVPLPALAFFTVSLIYVLKYRGGFGNRKSPLFGALFASAAAIFFASELSYPVWTFPNPISQINLPYRFTSVLYTTVVFVSGLLFVDAIKKERRLWQLVFCCAFSASFLLGLAALYKSNYIDGTPLPQAVTEDDYSFKNIKDAFRSSNYFEECKEQKDKCVEAHRAAAGFRGVPEYELNWAESGYIEFAQKDYREYCRELKALCKLPERMDSGYVFKFLITDQTTILLPVFYFPAWSLENEGNEFPIEIDRPTGLISVALPPGEHALKLVWRSTPVERVGAGLTVLSLVSLLVYGTFRRRRLGIYNLSAISSSATKVRH